MTKKHILIYGLKHNRWEYAKKFGYVSSYDEGTVPVFIDYYNTKITEILESEHSKKESKNESSFWHSAEEFKIFSKEWLNYVPEHTKHWPLWESYFRCTQTNPKNELQVIYKKITRIDHFLKPLLKKS
ncbi:hypothetical protein AALA44_02765 [Enterococcus ratti]|uniref:hypothetical protein n=1 Tax=Enterococcus ratti TaxID=150033 RepID=UPI0035185E1B